MSHRLLLPLLDGTPYRILSTATRLKCFGRWLPVVAPLLSRQQLRMKGYGSATMDGFSVQQSKDLDYNDWGHCEATRKALREKSPMPTINKEQAEMLLFIAWGRMIVGFKAEHTCDVLVNYRRYLDNPMYISDVRRRATVKRSQDLDEYTAVTNMLQRPIEVLGHHSKQDLAWLLCFEAQNRLEMSLEDAGPGNSNLKYGLWLLTIASLAGNSGAACVQLKFCDDPAYQAMLRQKSILVDTAPATLLVRQEVRDDPDNCPWRVLATWFADEYAETKLRRKTLAEIDWAIKLLESRAERLSPGEPSTSIMPWGQIGSPWKILQKIVVYCVQHSIIPPSRTQESLRELLERCLEELTTYNDPDASFELAIQKQAFGSVEWVRGMQIAASAGNADAAWLLALHSWRRDGFVSTEKADLLKLEASLGSQYSYVSQMATDHSKDLMTRAMGHAALFRRHGLYSDGLEVLDTALEEIKASSATSASDKKLMGNHHSDYQVAEDSPGGWDDSKCDKIINQTLNPDRWTQKLVQRMAAIWG